MIVEKEAEQSKHVSRRTVLGALAGGAALAAAGPFLPTAAIASGITDVDIVNFALNLEYLEAEFYSYAVTGKGIEQFGIDTDEGQCTYGLTTGGTKVPGLPSFVQPIANEIMVDEVAHVKLLRGLLGSAAIKKPAINLNALHFGFANNAQFLVLSRAFEDTGVTAYNGAAPLLQSKTILGYASRILGTEAEHVGNIRVLVAAYGLKTSPLDSLDVLPPPSGSRYFSTDNNGLTIARTVAQVLNIVKPFFPHGLNGVIH